MVIDRAFGDQSGGADDRHRIRVDPRYHDAVLFDLDGVITDTASIHQAAWAQMFDEFLGERTPSETENHDPFTPARLPPFRRRQTALRRGAGLSGLPRRDVALGRPPPMAPRWTTICGLGNRKQELFAVRIAHGVPVFESTIALVRLLRDAGVRVAVYSASRNCRAVLESAGIEGLFEAVVDGVVAEELGLAGQAGPRDAGRSRASARGPARPHRGGRGLPKPG